MRKIIPFLTLILVGTTVLAQTVTVKDTVYTTYGFSDPNPIPLTSGNVYPYHKYETFDFDSTQKIWKVVVLDRWTVWQEGAETMQVAHEARY